MLGVPNFLRRHTGAGSPAAATCGFRRVDLVRVWTGVDGSRFEVEGVVHRYPVVRPVSAGMASRLVAAGAPLVIRPAGPETGGAPC